MGAGQAEERELSQSLPEDREKAGRKLREAARNPVGALRTCGLEGWICEEGKRPGRPRQARGAGGRGPVAGEQSPDGTCFVFPFVKWEDAPPPPPPRFLPKGSPQGG